MNTAADDDDPGAFAIEVLNAVDRLLPTNDRPSASPWRADVTAFLEQRALRWRVEYGGAPGGWPDAVSAFLLCETQQCEDTVEGAARLRERLGWVRLRVERERKSRDRQRWGLIVSLTILSVAALFVVPLIAASAGAPNVAATTAFVIIVGCLAALYVASTAGSRALEHLHKVRWAIYAFYGPALLLGSAAATGAFLGQHKREYLWLAWGALSALLVLGALRAWQYRTPPSASMPLTDARLLPTDGNSDVDGSAPFDAALASVGYRATMLARAESRNAIRWFIGYIAVAVLAAVSASAAGLAVLPSGSGIHLSSTTFGLPGKYVAIFALVGAAATALSSGLNPGYEWKQSKQRAKSLERLSREADVMRTLDLSTYHADRPREAVQYLLNKLDSIQQTPGADESFWTPPSAKIAGGELQVTHDRLDHGTIDPNA